ncbi:MAG TPA: DUF2586 family protein, partial [Bacteroidales bacterium]|nr:DUF2586 family protein [Bacteroidales bacterium]
MNGITFVKGQGGVPKTLPGEDHYSGLVAYVLEADLPSGFSTTARIKSFSSIVAAETAGIVSTSTDWIIKVLHYHISEFFKIAPSGILYVGLFEPAATTYDYTEVKTLQNYAEGKLRQIAVYNPNVNVGAGVVTALQTVATTLDSQYKPASLLLAANVAAIADLTDMSAPGQQNVSVVIGQDGSGTAKTLFDDESATGSVTCIGRALGALSLAAVHESIAWVQKFPAGIDNPAMADGSLVKELDESVLEALNTKRFIFLRKHGGIAGSYFNDSHTMELATSDYAFIESVRTMDKAIRGIRTYVLPYLSSPLYVNPSTGKLRQDTCSFLETLAGKAP